MRHVDLTGLIAEEGSGSTVPIEVKLPNTREKIRARRESLHNKFAPQTTPTPTRTIAENYRTKRQSIAQKHRFQPSMPQVVEQRIPEPQGLTVQPVPEMRKMRSFSPSVSSVRERARKLSGGLRNRFNRVRSITPQIQQPVEQVSPQAQQVVQPVTIGQKYRQKRNVLRNRFNAQPPVVVPEVIPEPERITVQQVPPLHRRRFPVQVVEEEEIPPFPRRTPLQVIEEPGPRPLQLIERTRDVESVLPVPEYSEVIQEPVIIPIVRPEERSSILRRAFARNVVQENDQDYSPTIVFRRKFAPKRRFAPVTEQVQEQRQVTQVVDTFDPQYTSYVDAQATQTVAVAPVDNIPVFPMPSAPNAFIFNNSPSSDVEIAPYAKLVIKSSPKPVISVSSIATSYLTNLLNSTPSIRVSADVRRPYRHQSSLSEYY